MRQRLGAGDHESTRDAYLRWGLSKTNEIDRRREITDNAIAESQKQFLGMQGDISTFEESLAHANPDISDEERTHIRRIYNIHQQGMEKDFGGLKTLVQKAYNTIAKEEGLKTSFEAEPYDSTVIAAADFTKNLKVEDFPKVVMMLAQVAEANGQDNLPKRLRYL